MKVLIILSVALLFGTASFSQSLKDPGTPEERAVKITQQMQASLHLDSIQLRQVEALNLKYAKIAQEEIVDQGLNKWSMYRQGTKLNAQKEKELKPLLSAKQWERYEQQKKQIVGKILGFLF